MILQSERRRTCQRNEGRTLEEEENRGLKRRSIFCISRKHSKNSLPPGRSAY